MICDGRFGGACGGQGSQQELASWFGVSLGWVEKIIRQQRQTGQADRVEQRHGPVSRVDAAAQALLAASAGGASRSHAGELQCILAEQRGVSSVSVAQEWATC